MRSVLMPKLSFGFALLIGLFVLFQMGLFAVHPVWNAPLQWNLFQYCLAVVRETAVGHDLVKTAFRLLIVYTVGRILWRIIRQWVSTRKWTRVIRSRTDRESTERLNDRYRHWKTRFVAVRDDAFVAVTMGLFKPRIVVSTGLFRMFSGREAEAVLLHERYHCRRYDPLKSFLLAVIAEGLAYIPIIKAAARHYRIWKELLADRYVIRQMGTEYYLGKVLLRLSDGKVRKAEGGVSFADAAINYRILQVLDPGKPVSISFLRPNPLIASASVLLAVFGMGMGGCS